MVMNQYCRMMASLCPNMLAANILVPGSTMILLLFCGFFIPQDHMPYYFIWIYYISPVHYAIEGLFINEFTKYSVRDILCAQGNYLHHCKTVRYLARLPILSLRFRKRYSLMQHRYVM